MGLMVLGAFSQSGLGSTEESPRRERQIEQLEGGIRATGRDDESLG